MDEYKTVRSQLEGIIKLLNFKQKKDARQV